MQRHQDRDDTLVDRARAAHPRLRVDPSAFAEHLAGCAPEAVGASALNVEDLYLAFAAGNGEPRALAVIEERYLARMGRFVAHLGKQPSFVDEVRQHLRERLLVGGGDEGSRTPKILDYSGRGSLGAWLRVAATRQALDLLERDKRHAPGADELEEDQLAASVDPELIAIRQRHLPQFRQAFRAALDSLNAQERNLLRFYLVDGLNIGRIGEIFGKSIGRIGEIFGKSRATIGRMVIDCRKKLLDDTRRHLGALTGASEGDVRSLIRLLQSQLDVSIRGFLGRDGPPR
ncbi:MAG: RNA polymerase subunit sigma-70 [Myxococcales bacterium]